MSLIESIVVCLGLLLTPGPTNTLLALAAATQGCRSALRLLPAEVAGYLLTVTPLLIFGQKILASAPDLQTLVKIMAGLWVGVLAIRLWRPSQAGIDADGVTPGRVFLTTLLNPKGLLFGLLLFQAVQDGQGSQDPGTLEGGILSVATVWVFLGAFAQGAPEIRIRRVASLVLVGLSALLLQSGIAAAL